MRLTGIRTHVYSYSYGGKVYVVNCWGLSGFSIAERFIIIIIIVIIIIISIIIITGLMAVARYGINVLCCLGQS
jgi:hypothetical protein